MGLEDLRQTEFSMSELMLALEAPAVYRRCLVVNEIGLMCLFGKDDFGQGEKVLLNLLEVDDPNSQIAAFCWLSSIGSLAERNASRLKKFREDPFNKEHIKIADGMISAFAKQLENLDD